MSTCMNVNLPHLTTLPDRSDLDKSAHPCKRPAYAQRFSDPPQNHY